MESVLRAIGVYVVLVIIFRLSGKRTLTSTTPFDLVMLLIISETVQQALLTQDDSITNAFLLVVTLVLLDIGISMWKQRSKRFSRLIEGLPIILFDNGNLNKDFMKKTRTTEDDILEASRGAHGISRMDEIKYAILENNGTITIIPKEKINS